MICAICDKTYSDAACYMVSVCPDCKTHAAIGRAVVENKSKLKRAFHDTGHRCDATAMCQGIVDMIEAREQWPDKAAGLTEEVPG